MAEEAENTAPTGNVVDPYLAYNFKLQVQGVTEGHFTEIGGLGVKVEAIPYREGGGNGIVRRLLGPVRYGDVTLRYGLTDSTELWEWFKKSINGEVDRRNVSILMLNTAGTQEVLRWNLINAWLSQWRAAPLDALGREVAIESLTMVYETVDRVEATGG